ncbi:radical SAM protein [Thermodesulfobacteriota bacterium]
MPRRSSVGLWVPLKHLRRIAPHQWIGAKLVKLELEKHVLGLVHRLFLNGRGGRIRQVSIRITDLCNLRCGTCGQWGERGFLHGKDTRMLKQKEVSPRRHLEVLADLVAHGHRPLLYLWGGEPMLYEGVLDVTEGATRMGLPTSIATNGTRVAACADRLVEAPLFLLQISIDGHTATLHNNLRPSKGHGNNFLQVHQALDAVSEARKRKGRSLPLIASLTVVSKENFRYLERIYEVFREKVDIFVFYLSWWIDEKHAGLHEDDFRRRFGFTPTRHRGWIGSWKPDDFKLLDRQLRKLVSLSRRWEAPPVTIIPGILGEKSLETYYRDHDARFGYDQCISIYQVVEINSNGDVSPCRDYHDYVVGNIKESTIDALWNSSAYCGFRRSISTEGLTPVCSRCCGLMGY